MSFDKMCLGLFCHMSRSVLGNREMLKVGPLLGLNL